MSFIARHFGTCGFCGEELKGTKASFASDDVLVHTGCLIPYVTGVNPIATMSHRDEHQESVYEGP